MCVDHSVPNKKEIEALQTAFDTYYEDLKLSIYETDIKFQGHQGFNLPTAYWCHKVRVNDDFAISFNGDIEYVRIQKCLVVEKLARRFCFIFPLWYNIISNYGIIPLVSKWEGNDNQLLPFPVHFVREQVLVLHDCGDYAYATKKGAFVTFANQQRCALII